MSIEKMNFKRWVHKVLPAVYDESLSYYDLLCKVMAKLNETIELSNGTAEGLKELQDYVDNYFENLDVQQEINNKLDEMAESGELAEIIAQYVELKSILAYNNIAEMKTATNLVEGSLCKTYGKTSYNDGLGQFYKVREVLNTDTIDDIIIVGLSDPELVAELVPNMKELNVKYFGATGDGETDDILAIKKTIDYAKEKGINNILIPIGTYIVSDQIVIPSNLNLYGEGESSILKASNYNSGLTYKCMIRVENPQMDDGGNNTRNITIKRLSLNNNGISDAGQEGIIQLRGVRNATLEDLNITVNGDNCWGVILFSANHDILINKCIINNVSADNSIGGCLWIRSGLNCNVDGRKTKDVNITNCYMTTTTKDEIICIADGVDGGWTEANFENIEVEGKAETTLGNFLIVANTVTNTGYIRANFNNINIKGKTGTYAFYVHSLNNDLSKIDFTASNINITLNKGGGIQGGYNTDYFFNNCNIKLTEVKRAAYGVNISNSKSNSTFEACIVKGCSIIVPDNRNCCEDCGAVTDSILKTTGKGIHTYGGARSFIANNMIFANVNAIHLQNNGTTGAKDTIIIGNYLQRYTDSDNSGSVAISVPYIKNSNTAQNRYLLHGSEGTSYGFRYYETASSSSEYYRNDYATTV